MTIEVLTGHEMAKDLGITYFGFKALLSEYNIPGIRPYDHFSGRFDKRTVRQFLRRNGVRTPNNVQTSLLEVRLWDYYPMMRPKM